MDTNSTGSSHADPAERAPDARQDGSAPARRSTAGGRFWYMVAVVLVVLTAWFRFLTDPILGDVSRFLPFVLIVAICTYGGGVGPGIASIGLSTVVGSALFIDQPLSLNSADFLNLAIFIVEAGGIAFLTGALRRARDQARLSASRAETTARRQDQFVTRVSHEWTAPINVLAGWAAQLSARPHDSEFVGRAAANMMRAIETQKRLLGDLLDYSRGSRGRLSIHPVRLLILTPIEASIDAVRQEAAIRNIDLSLRLEDPGLRVWGDNQRLQQVFTNLLTNSIKFTAKGGRITVRGRRIDDLVEVEVEDNGAGIDPRQLQEVFEPFSQGQPTRDAALGGLGLGLSIAREIVLLHAGSIEATSRGHGLGSTFTVRLPVSAAVTTPATAEPDTAGEKRG